MGTFSGRGARQGRPLRSGGGQNEIYLTQPLPKDQDSAMVWVLDQTPPVVLNEAGEPVDADGNVVDRDKTNKMVPNWIHYEQHFDNQAKRGWPCGISENTVNCVGCEFPVEDPTNENDRGNKVRDLSSQYIIPVINEKGYTSLIQMGWGLWQSFVAAYLEYGTVTDAWYRVRRSKIGNKVQYSATKTDNREAPEVKVEPPNEAFIEDLLGQRYIEAMQRYGYEPDTPASDTDTVGGEGQDVASEPTAGPDTSSDSWDLSLNAKEASLGELKDWLANIPAKFGGPREVIKGITRTSAQGLVEAAQVEFDTPPY